MSDDIKKEAQEQAEQAYALFLRFMKLFLYSWIISCCGL